MDINSIYFFFDSVKNKLSQDEINTLDDIYSYIEESSDMIIQLEKENEILSNHIEETFNTLKTISNESEKEIPSKLNTFLENKECDPSDVWEILYTKNQKDDLQKQKEEILTMVKRGFVFNSGVGKKIYDDYVREQNKLITEQKLKAHEKAFQEKLTNELKQLNSRAKIKLIDNDTIEIWEYNAIDVIVNVSTYEMKGKGTRKYKDLIIEITKLYTSLFNEYNLAS